jgi:hypothetical protein
MRKSTLLASAAALVCATTQAHAYLDPGTGSIILQATIAAVASSLFAIKMYWFKLKSMFGMKRVSADTNDDDNA